MPTTTAPAKIAWYVVLDGERIPFNRQMRGTWGFDATCSCGWDSRTGGATRRSVRVKVEDHKTFDHDQF